jgi:hypothetical protein
MASAFQYNNNGASQVRQAWNATALQMPMEGLIDTELSWLLGIFIFAPDKLATALEAKGLMCPKNDSLDDAISRLTPLQQETINRLLMPDDMELYWHKRCL